MKHTTKTIDELIAHPELAPLPIDAIPNQMGINLCSVHGMSLTQQEDGQLVTLTIHFIPGPDMPPGPEEPGQAPERDLDVEVTACNR